MINEYSTLTIDGLTPEQEDYLLESQLDLARDNLLAFKQQEVER